VCEGRVKNTATTTSSSNTCAVISPCLVNKHLTGLVIDGTGVSESEIANCIDAEIAPIAVALRLMLQLPENAFMSPADVNDYLFTEGIIARELSDVFGGSAWDETHIGNLIDWLQASEQPKTELRGAAFFFHQHVTTILKCAGEGFDFIDSLPQPPKGTGVRIRCRDAEALRKCLAWYTSSKFSKAEQAYVEANPTWRAEHFESDPRVFQAYAWR